MRYLFYSSYVLNIPDPLHDYFTVLRELGLFTSAGKKIHTNIRFLHNLIGGSADAPSHRSLINFRVPTRRSIAPFTITKRSTNNPIDRLMRLPNYKNLYLYNIIYFSNLVFSSEFF